MRINADTNGIEAAFPAHRHHHQAIAAVSMKEDPC